MTSKDGICQAIHSLIDSVGVQARTSFDENCVLLGEARALHQDLQRIGVVISGILPFIKGIRAWSILREVENTLSSLLHVLLDASSKGSLIQYLRADRILARFTTAAARLDAALGGLQEEAWGKANSAQRREDWPGGANGSCSGANPAAGDAAAAAGLYPLDDIGAELRLVRELLQRARFGLPAAHATNIKRFRDACDGLHAHFQTMMLSYNELMEHTGQERILTKESFRALIADLQVEVELLQLQQQQQQEGGELGAGLPCGDAPAGRRGPPHPHSHPSQPTAHPHGVGHLAALEPTSRQCAAAEQHQLRMLMDVIRASHLDTDCEAPLDFLCPLTHQLMKDPVLLHETGHSYERKALEEWWARGHRFCPRTGLRLWRLNISPNHNLRSAIERWYLHNDLHLSFKPVLSTLVSQQRQRLPTPPRQQQRLQQTSGLSQGKRAPDQVPELAQGRTQSCAATVGSHLEKGAPTNGSLSNPGCLDEDSTLQANAGEAGPRGSSLAPTQQGQPPPPQRLGCAAPQACAVASISSCPTQQECCAPHGNEAGLHGPQQGGGGRLHGAEAGDLTRRGSEAATDGTGHCHPCMMDTPQQTSSEELDLSGYALWSGVEGSALGHAGPCDPTDLAGTCNVGATVAERTTGICAYEHTKLDGGDRTHMACLPSRADVVRTSRGHEVRAECEAGPGHCTAAKS